MSKHNRYREEEKEELEKQGKTLEDEVQVEDVKEEVSLDVLQAQIDSLTDQLLRNRAELENFKRRSNEERINERKYCLQPILTDLIEIIDLFDAVVNTKTDDEKVKSFLIGFQMLNNKFKELLESYQVKKIDCLNQKFDHNFHEAVSFELHEDLEEETIVKVVSNGYVYKDRVLRPSKVIVSKKENKED